MFASTMSCVALALMTRPTSSSCLALGLNGRRLRAEHAASAILVRAHTLIGKQRLYRRPSGVPLQLTGLHIEAPDRREFFGVAKLCPVYRGLQHADSAVVDLQRHGIGMPVLATMSDRESRRVAEAIGRAMDDLGDLGERSDSPGADARDQQEFREILRTAFSGSRQIAVQASSDNVLGPDIVMGGHDEMRQHGLGLWARRFDVD